VAGVLRPERSRGPDRDELQNGASFHVFPPFSPLYSTTEANYCRSGEGTAPRTCLIIVSAQIGANIYH
jgi:hypothetical protein